MGGDQPKNKLIRSHHKVSRSRKKCEKDENKEKVKAAKIPSEIKKIEKSTEKSPKVVKISKDKIKHKHKNPEPSFDDPLRAFYESLLQQNPNSQMARKYCIEHGILKE
ncbi:unnamed protein product [Blepharisma stoltei]|uniref:Uncharacterized protein n=1 Tax=Blepharisma stoltei TaxID=1481888 RepID=A0AAU9IHA6_9CILI|nr:unnamed protein product [Blepharisma stoltei]